MHGVVGRMIRNNIAYVNNTHFTAECDGEPVLTDHEDAHRYVEPPTSYPLANN